MVLSVVLTFKSEEESTLPFRSMGLDFYFKEINSIFSARIHLISLEVTVNTCIMLKDSFELSIKRNLKKKKNHGWFPANYRAAQLLSS